MNITCHHLLLIPDPDPSLNCWGGNPYCLVFFSGFKSNWNVDMTQWSARPPNHKQWYHAGPFAQESKRLMPYAPHFPLNTKLPTSKHLKCFPNLISVEGHTDWITVTVPIGLSTTNDQFYTHPPSHPWVCITHCQEGWVPGLYCSCRIVKALSIIIRTHPSNPYNIIHPALELHTNKKRNKPATTQECQSLDAKAHWLRSCTSFTTNQPERY